MKARVVGTLKTVLLAAGLWAAQTVGAAPIVYEGNIAPAATVGGTLVGTQGYQTGNTSGRDWWTFSGTAGDLVFIRGARQDGGLDLGFSLYFGTTAADESTFSFNSSFGGLTYLTFQDDNWGPNIPGPFADPELVNFLLPSSGTYSIAVVSVLNNSSCGECQYTLSVRENTPTGEVPEPGTIALLGAGLLGLAAARRRMQA